MPFLWCCLRPLPSTGRCLVVCLQSLPSSRSTCQIAPSLRLFGIAYRRTAISSFRRVVFFISSFVSERADSSTMSNQSLPVPQSNTRLFVFQSQALWPSWRSCRILSFLGCSCRLVHCCILGCTVDPLWPRPLRRESVSSAVGGVLQLDAGHHIGLPELR